MKIAVTSDVHLEFGDLVFDNSQNADVLILSGDIFVERDLGVYDRRQQEMGFMGHRSERIHNFFQRCSEQFKDVVYVTGNHEHYHGDFKYTLSEIKKNLAYLPNVHVLDKEMVKIDDTIFVGGTLWTNMNNEDPLTLHSIRSMMNDFRCVKNSNRVVYRTVPLYKRKEDDSGYELDEKGFMIQTGTKKKEEPSTFCPEDAVEDNKKCFEYIKHVVSECPPWEQVVVVGHHTPSRQSCHPRYSEDQLMNGGYHNDYEEYIMDHPQIKLWTHGHTHEKYDYMIGSTRVVCNPRGYIGHESIADNFELKVVEI